MNVTQLNDHLMTIRENQAAQGAKQDLLFVKVEKIEKKVDMAPCKINSKEISNLKKIVYGAVTIILVGWLSGITGTVTKIKKQQAVKNEQPTKPAKIREEYRQGVELIEQIKKERREGEPEAWTPKELEKLDMVAKNERN